jgi:hypothetical protein
MNIRFFVTAAVALLLAAAYDGAAKRSERTSASGPGQAADAQSAQPSAPVTVRASRPSHQAVLPRS